MFELMASNCPSAVAQPLGQKLNPTHMISPRRGFAEACAEGGGSAPLISTRIIAAHDGLFIIAVPFVVGA